MGGRDGTCLSKANLFTEGKEVLFEYGKEHLSEIQKGATQYFALYPQVAIFIMFHFFIVYFTFYILICSWD